MFEFINNLVKNVVDYIAENSIDFIAIISSIIIAIEADKFIENRKKQSDKKDMLKDLPVEISRLLDCLQANCSATISNKKDNKLSLRLTPYITPIWDSIYDTDKLNLLANENSYSEILNFYTELKILNDWENVLTYYILFSDDKSKYSNNLIEEVIRQQDKCINLAKKTITKLRSDTRDGR